MLKRAQEKTHVKTRRHGKVYELPEEIRKQVNALLIEPNVTYEDIAAFLKGKGQDITKSSIGRYGQWFFNEVRETEMLRDQAALITSDPDKALLLEKLTATMLTKRLAIAMQSAAFDVLDHAKLIDAFAKLQASSTNREKWSMEIRKKVDKTAEDVSRIAKKNGLSESAAGQIRNKILGIK